MQRAEVGRDEMGHSRGQGKGFVMKKTPFYYLRGSGHGGVLTRGRGDVFRTMGSGHMMRGAGLGSVFSTIFSSVLPIAKAMFRKVGGVAKTISKSSLGQGIKRDLQESATKAGLGIVGDTLAGKNVLESAKQNLKGAASEVGKKAKKRAMDQLSARVPPEKKPKRSSSSSHSKPAAAKKSEPIALKKGRANKAVGKPQKAVKKKPFFWESGGMAASKRGSGRRGKGRGKGKGKRKPRCKKGSRRGGGGKRKPFRPARKLPQKFSLLTI